jgi:hypothetical protein
MYYTINISFTDINIIKHNTTEDIDIDIFHKIITKIMKELNILISTELDNNIIKVHKFIKSINTYIEKTYSLRRQLSLSINYDVKYP